MDSPNDSQVQCQPLTDGNSAVDVPQTSWSMLSTRRPISELADECRYRLEDCIYIETLMEQEWAADRLAEFTSWAAGRGVFASGKDSLDERLSANLVVKGLIKNLLIILTFSIDECKELGEFRHITLHRLKTSAQVF